MNNKIKSVTTGNSESVATRDEFQELIDKKRIIDFSNAAKRFKIKTRLAMYSDAFNYLTSGLNEEIGVSNIEEVLQASGEYYTKLLLESYHKWSKTQDGSTDYAPGIERTQKVFCVDDVTIPNCKIEMNFCGNFLTRPGVEPFYIVGVVMTDKSKTVRALDGNEILWKKPELKLEKKSGKRNKKSSKQKKKNKSTLLSRLKKKLSDVTTANAETVNYYDEYDLLIKNKRIIDFSDSAKKYNIKSRLAIYHDTYLFITQDLSDEIAEDNLDKILTVSTEAYAKLMLESYHKWYKNKGETTSYTPGFERSRKIFHVEELNLPNGKIEFNFCGNLLTRPDEESFFIIGKLPKGKLKAMVVERSKEIIWKE